jgi:hypothetical protein
MTDSSVNINFSCISVNVKKENNGMYHGISSGHDTGIEERNGAFYSISRCLTIDINSTYDTLLCQILVTALSHE